MKNKRNIRPLNKKEIIELKKQSKIYNYYKILLEI